MLRILLSATAIIILTAQAPLFDNPSNHIVPSPPPPDPVTSEVPAETPIGKAYRLCQQHVGPRGVYAPGFEDCIDVAKKHFAEQAKFRDTKPTATAPDHSANDRSLIKQALPSK